MYWRDAKARTGQTCLASIRRPDFDGLCTTFVAVFSEIPWAAGFHLPTQSMLPDNRPSNTLYNRVPI